jgi:ATP-dependent helicase HrpA
VLSGSVDLAMLPGMTDMKAQVGRLVHRGFVADAGLTQLRRLPTYLAAVRTRRERLGESVNRDRALMDQIGSLQEAYLNRVAALPEGRPSSDGLVQVRWMLEEYRISLWAQQLGTAYPVSDSRIRKALDAL